MSMLVRCRNCETIYDLNIHEDCPGCGQYPGSALGNVDVLKKENSSYQEEGQYKVTGKIDDHVDRDLAIKEYFQCLQLVDGFDQRALTIKAWSVTASLAGIVTGFTNSTPNIFLVSSIASLIFWWLEGRWKTVQSAYISRSVEIAKYLRGESVDNFQSPDMRLNTMKPWYRHGRSRLKNLSLQSHVYLPHAVVVFLGILLWVLNLAGINLF